MVDLNGGLEVSHTLVEMRKQIELLQERVSALEAVKPPDSDKADLADLRSKVEKMLGTAPSGPAANPQHRSRLSAKCPAICWAAGHFQPAPTAMGTERRRP